jgi:hypothetical protein
MFWIIALACAIFEQIYFNTGQTYSNISAALPNTVPDDRRGDTRTKKGDIFMLSVIKRLCAHFQTKAAVMSAGNAHYTAIRHRDRSRYYKYLHKTYHRQCRKRGQIVVHRSRRTA